MANNGNGSPFIDDEGPGFDPDAAAQDAQNVETEQAQAAGGHLFELPEIDEEKVRSVLRNGGDGIHALVGVGEYDWVCTQRDLDRIAPPLTNILNRYDAARVAGTYADELALTIGVGLYGWRSLLERAAVLRMQEAGEPIPAPRAAARPAPAPPPPPPPSPAPAPRPPASAAGGDHFPGAGAPREPDVAAVEVVPGYTTRAEQIRAARERATRPDAIPAEAPRQAL